MRTNIPTRSPRPPADKVLLALVCLAEGSPFLTISAADVGAQARIPEDQVLPALRELERRGELDGLRARKDGTWLVTLASEPDAPEDTITVPWADPIMPPRTPVMPPMPPDLPLPFYWPNRKVARSFLKIIGALQSMAVDGLACVTLAEICEVSGMRDVNTVKFHLDRLETEGVIGVYYGREFGRARRAFEVLKPVEVPVAIWPGVSTTAEVPDATSPDPEPEVTPAPMPVLTLDAPRRVVATVPPKNSVGQLCFAWADGTA